MASNSLQSLDDIFTKSLFRIPDYQRGFSWERKQLEDFWDDLERLDDNKNHYTGLLTLKELTDAAKIDKALTADDKWKIGKGFGFKVFHVVDGQQRLTTAIILINALARHFSAKNQTLIMGGVDIEQNIVSKYIRDISKTPAKFVACIFGYEHDKPGFDCLKFEIFKCATAGFNNKEQTYYTNNLKNADEFFSDKIAKLSATKGDSAVEDIFEKLLHHMQFNIHEISDDFDEYVSFETMNNRGKELSKLELLKNRLIYLTTLFDDTYTDTDRDKLRDEINRAWMEVYHWLGKKVDSRRDTSDDDLLRQHWIIYFKSPSHKPDELMKFLLKDTFSPKKLKRNKHASKAADEVDYDAIRCYTESLLEFAAPYYHTYYPQDCPDIADEEKRLLDALTPSSGRLTLGEFRPLVMAVLHKAKNLNTNDRLEFFKALERLLFIHSLKKNTRADFGGFSYTLAQDFYRGRINLSDITARLKSYADNERIANVKNFVLHVEECFGNDGAGNFKGGYYALEKFLRHVLYEYECTLAKQNGLNKIADVKSLFASDRGAKISVEHIYPQTSTAYWDGVFGGCTPQQKATLLGSLGNLLLLSQKLNSALQNDDFSKKKSRYQNNSHSAIEVAQNSQWTATEIRARSEKLLDFIEKRWGLTFTNDQRQKLIPQ